MPKTKRQRCFVIMPIAKTSTKHTKLYWTRHFNSFLKPLIEESGDIEAERSEPLRGDILRQIITCIVTCPVVVADITDENPNVYWELGVRHSFKHGTVIIAEEGTGPRFNISTQGILFYNPTDYANEDFRKRFKASIKSCLSEPERTDSHVLETISGRGTLFEVFRRDEALRRLDALLFECSVNRVILEEVMKRADENLKYPNKRAALTTFFMTAAVELLLTNRYVDVELKIYQLAQIYLNWISALNGRIVGWFESGESNDRWFLEQKENVERVATDFNNQVATILKEIAERL